MLSDSERVRLREIEKNLADDPEFVRSFQAAAPPHNRRSQKLAEFAALAVLLAVVLVIVGAHGAAVIVAAGAFVLGLTSHIERCDPSRPADPWRTES